MLACLAQCMPIEFNSTNYIAQALEKKQEGHMQVCLKINAAFESMVTILTSEPILAEAAYFVMAQKFFHAPVHSNPLMSTLLLYTCISSFLMIYNICGIFGSIIRLGQYCRMYF